MWLLLRCSERPDGSWTTSATDVYETWYKTLEMTLSCLSKIFRCVGVS